ncbi:VOC family protein [Niallia taxi]|uniref:VOC family protein n=1 Tax=Niallia taxi TaxID=2499688 RepID=A0A3S2W4G5_9BACI|nr:VOC family protein [Niallia taxi]MCM3217203.1 VOC family protein [Niallia taxi]MDK8642679.1 VOC family protein [Niallia taxi]MED4037415.1 VOC family protein [Niallia taxi]MED4054698.1 VOC family protein [Niallia taxi]MED4121290.1 VOC family protein [Niallia taxi]
MIKSMYPYFVLNGNGREAVEFYKNALNAEVISVQLFGDMPQDSEKPLPEEAKNRVLNAQLKVGNIDLMLSDNFPGMPYSVGTNVTTAIILEDPEDTKRVFAALEEGGKVKMPLQETFWSPLYGQVEDKYGFEWQVSTEGKLTNS